MTSFAVCRRQKTAIELVVLAALLAWSVAGVAGDLARIPAGLPFMADYVRGMVPPDWSILPSLWEPWVETVRMAVVSIVLASIVALPLSFLANRATTPHLLVYLIVRGMINFLRTMPTLLLAILFVAMVGLGPLAGILALTSHCIGALGKYFAETIEATMHVVAEIMEAMRMDGASKSQSLYYGLLPEIAPLFISYILYYFEWALRVGTIMGLVGAGGLGLYLTMTIRLFKRQQTLAVVLVILFTVTAVDGFSYFVRRGLVA
jgi:phosphonate transport system permease protein